MARGHINILRECSFCANPFVARARLQRFCNRRCHYFFYVVQTKDACWGWTGAVSQFGYGAMSQREGKNLFAHRYSWELHNGQRIPEGLLVCHKCDCPPCTNPDHLFLGTDADNSRDCLAKGRHRHGEPLKGVSHPWAKLTEDQVREIRGSSETGVAMAKKFGVSNTTITGVRQRKIWAHI